jgi:hypothetical protein
MFPPIYPVSREGDTRFRRPGLEDLHSLPKELELVERGATDGSPSENAGRRLDLTCSGPRVSRRSRGLRWRQTGALGITRARSHASPSRGDGRPRLRCDVTGCRGRPLLSVEDEGTQNDCGADHDSGNCCQPHSVSVVEGLGVSGAGIFGWGGRAERGIRSSRRELLRLNGGRWRCSGTSELPSSRAPCLAKSAFA